MALGKGVKVFTYKGERRMKKKKENEDELSFVIGMIMLVAMLGMIWLLHNLLTSPGIVDKAIDGLIHALQLLKTVI